MSDRITIQEKYAGALSGSLQNDCTHRQPEYIMAVALGADEFSAMLIRAKAGDCISPRLLDVWRSKVAAKASRRGWTALAQEVADTSMSHYLDGHCLACEGRGHQVIADTPMLEDAPCVECGGTKVRPVGLGGEIGRLVIEAIEMLDASERAAARASVLKLKESCY